MAGTDEMILFSNNLTYTLPVPSSVVVNKCKKRSYFQNRSYASGQTMVATLNSGADFIDLANSSLVVKLDFSTTNVDPYSCEFGSGSAMNVVDNIRIFHRSGTQYTNTQKMNAYRVIEDHNCESENWFNTVGKNMGYKQAVGAMSPFFGNNQTFVIPLNKLHNFFSPHGGCMGPPQMFSGLRAEIDLATIGNIVKYSGLGGFSAPTDYVVSEIYFDLESVSLMDSAQASINTNAQKRALEYLYSNIFTSRSSTPSNASAINVDINKSVAYAEKVFALVQTNANQNTTAADSYVNPYKNGNWWYQLGSLQFPSNIQISDDAVAYADNLAAWNKMKGKCGERGETELTLDEFRTKYGVYATSLELDASIALSGMPVTSSRTLRLEATLDAPLAEDSTTLVFMTYLASVRSTLTSSRVDI